MSQAVTEYRVLLAEIEQTRRGLLQRDRRWNLARTLLFLAAGGMLWLGHYLVENTLLALLGWALVFAFLVAVSLHERLRDALEAQRMRRSVLRRLIARTERNWDRLPLWNPKLGEGQAGRQAGDPSGGEGDPVAVADDLDVFGRGSLFQLVSMASLGPGLRRLATWLIGPARRATAVRRHVAGRELAGLRQWRIDFYTQARRAAAGTADPDRFLRWITSPSWLQRHPVLATWSLISPVLFFGLVTTILLGVTAFDFSDAAIRGLGAAIAAVVGLNLLISTFLLGDVHDIFASAVSGRGDIDGYQQMFALCEALPSGESELIQQVKQTLTDPQTGAAVAMRALRRISYAASLKHSGGLFLIYLMLQMSGLWDLHVLRRLERWQREHAADAGGWFEALGELEATASLAALLDENPDWASPQWLAGNGQPHTEHVLQAVQLGHPLLTDGVRVCNDVQIGPQGTLLLVTGSNMSGKSTLLRSVGLNVLLAGAGGPVCAQAFSLPDLELATSIRVRDNLGEGVSFYMAELKSLARVVRHAEALDERRRSLGDTQEVATLLYLLDEILQGTNSRERQIAVAHVLRHLIDRGAIGAISTHDLELADDPQLQAIAHTVHFRETIQRDEQGRDQMTFDYRMRHGVSPTTNALRLLEVVGLGTPAATSSSTSP